MTEPDRILQFYVTKASTGFRRVFGDDPNVVAVYDGEEYVQVWLLDLELNYYPVRIDGVPVKYSLHDMSMREVS